MTEVLFYHLENQPVERVLPPLLEKSLERGWRVVVQTASEERADALDSHLWTYRDDSFLPHGTWRDRDAADQPIILAVDERQSQPGDRSFSDRLLRIAARRDAYERLVLVFNGEDDDATAAARAAWSASKAKGFEVTYWQPDAQGRWQRKA